MSGMQEAVERVARNEGDRFDSVVVAFCQGLLAGQGEE